MSSTNFWRRMETSFATMVAIIYYTLNRAKDVKGFTAAPRKLSYKIMADYSAKTKQFKKTISEYSKLPLPVNALSYSFEVDVDSISTSLRSFGSWYTQVDNPVLNISCMSKSTNVKFSLTCLIMIVPS